MIILTNLHISKYTTARVILNDDGKHLVQTLSHRGGEITRDWSYAQPGSLFWRAGVEVAKAYLKGN